MSRKEIILAQYARGPWWLYPNYGIDSPAKMEMPPVVVMTAHDAEIEPADSTSPWGLSLFPWGSPSAP